MTYQDLLKKITSHYSSDLPFVVFSYPNSDELKLYAQETVELFSTDNFAAPGFVMAPFTESKKVPFIPEDKSELFQATLDNVKVSEEEPEIDFKKSERKKHLDLIKKSVSQIKEEKMDKVVVSRKKTLEIKGLPIDGLVDRLFKLYPTALRYFWHHPKVGTWCGATPEVLLSSKGNEFKTMALAGTKLHDPLSAPNWTLKEITEQKLVAESIAEKLGRLTAVLRVSKTRNHIAGSLVHLRTDFTGVLKRYKDSWRDMIYTLHPTPAICGTPRQEAYDFIDREEGYNRSFYTGFLGGINKEKNLQLFVNLRCLELTKSHANLYVGGGITKDSIAEDEWQETQNKLQTMLQVLAPFL